MILLAEHDEPSLAAKKKQQPSASSRPTSTPKNRVWNFENTPSGRPVVEPQLSSETATGSVQYTYQIASGRAEWLSRDPLPDAERSQGPNLYEYVKNSPIDMTDPLGLAGGGRGNPNTGCPCGQHAVPSFDQKRAENFLSTATGGYWGGIAAPVLAYIPVVNVIAGGYGSVAAMDSLLVGMSYKCVPN